MANWAPIRSIRGSSFSSRSLRALPLRRCTPETSRRSPGTAWPVLPATGASGTFGDGGDGGPATAAELSGVPSIALNLTASVLYLRRQRLLLRGILRGERFVKHSGVRAAVHRDLVKPGFLPQDLGRVYDRLFHDRQQGDHIEFVSFEADSDGYTGRPTVEGDFELGHEIVPALRGRGLATEVARTSGVRAYARGGCAVEDPKDGRSGGDEWKGEIGRLDLLDIWRIYLRHMSVRGRDAESQY